MAAVRSPNLSAANSPPSNYKGVGTLLKHWGTSEASTLDAKQIKICEDSGLDSLLHLIRMPHVKVQGLAMSVINSLREGENGDIHIDSEDGFRPLVDLAKFAEEDVQREAVWSLAILASNSSCQSRIEQEVGWHNFRKYAASNVPEIQAGTAILLGNLALEKRNQENLMVKGVPLLLNMMSDTTDPKVRRAVVTALSNVSIIENYGAKDVWLDKGIELMMPYIEQSEDMQLQIGALNTIANVCNHDQANELKKKVAQIGGIARLAPLLNSQDEMVVKLAAMTIANLASEEPHRINMHELKIEGPLVRLLDSRDEEVQLGVSMAINALADHAPACKEFRTRHAAEPLKELIQVSKDRDILKEAKEALRKIAPEEFEKLKLKLSASYSSSYSSEYSGSESDSSSSYSGSEDEGGAQQKAPKRSRTETATHSSMSESESESDSDSSGSEITNRPRAGSSFLVRQQHEAKRLEEERKFREEQERRRIQEQDEQEEEVRALAAAKAEDAGRDRALSASVEGGSNKENNRKSVNLTEEEVRFRRSEAARKKEKEEEEEVKKQEEIKKQAAEEEKRLRRPEGVPRLIRNDSSSSGGSSSTDEGDDASSSGKKGGKGGSRSSDEEEIPEEERRRREEDTRRRKEEEEKEAEIKAEEVRKKREEAERVRRVEEEEFQRREEVEKNNREELENSDTSSYYSRGSRRRRRNEGGSRRGSLGSIGSVQIPKNPAKALVLLLKDARHKKMIERDALRELDRYAHKHERDQVQHGEDIIAILVYIIYFYPDAEYPDIIILSLYLLALLARYSVRNQLAVRRAKGGEQIITLLQSGVEYVRRNAALALGAYTLNNKNIQGEVTRSIGVLTRILEGEGTPPATRRTVAACLAATADNHAQNQAQVIVSGALRAAVTMLPVDKHFLRSGLNLVAASVSHNINAQNQVLLDFPRFISDLVGMLAVEENKPFQDCIVNTLVELSKKNTRIQLAIYHADGIARLTPLLGGWAGEEDTQKMQLCVNVLYLLLTQIKIKKYGKQVREDLTRLRVVSTIQPMCAAKSRLLAETALNLTKVIEARN